MIAEWLCLISLFVYTKSLLHEKPVTLVEWQQPCRPRSMALNDCNWCTCMPNNKYNCNARACHEVDMFGHFNDAIAQINVGMEGHGVWRSTKTVCEPGVPYRRLDLICVCNEDGSWPSPVCRDAFRVLYSVQTTDQKEPKEQMKCTPTKLYLIGCKICYCPETGKINPTMCTKNCYAQDDYEVRDERDFNEVGEELSIYATCEADKKYKLGCKTCSCLKNNRLYCDNCTETKTDIKQSSQCENVEPGQMFNVDCNICICDKKGYAYCTVKKCLPTRRIFSNDPQLNSINLDELLQEKINSTHYCEAGLVHESRCMRCECFLLNGGSTAYTCVYRHPGCETNWNTAGVFDHAVPLRSRPKLSFEQSLEKLRTDCVANTVYEHNCHVCYCLLNKKGEKYETCELNSKCESAELKDLDEMHGYCEPLHVYKKDCNVCKCLSDGKTVRCTSRICDSRAAQEPITIDVVPVTQVGDPCPKGNSYKIDCNVCFCLSNGNAICTTIDCKKSRKS